LSSKVLVLIPTLNEAEGIEPTIKEVNSYLNDHEVLVVDASDKGNKTPEIAEKLGAKVLKQNGKGKGLGFIQALEWIKRNLNPEYVALLDGDYTYPAEHIPEMVKILKENMDVGMVTGKRFNKIKSFKVHIKNLLTNPYYFGNKFLRLTHRILNGVRLKDPLTGLRVIRYNLIKDYRFKAKSFDMEVELNNLIHKKGYKIKEIPIKYRQRLGEKKLKIRHGFAILKRIILMAIENTVKRS
jgi:dolichol-phosphate mannosyltransferase